MLYLERIKEWAQEIDVLFSSGRFRNKLGKAVPSTKIKTQKQRDKI